MLIEIWDAAIPLREGRCDMPNQFKPGVFTRAALAGMLANALDLKIVG